MIQTLYIERAITSDPRVQEIIGRFPGASQIQCERYGSVFNPRNQSFRLQKGNPSLILAHKFDNHVLPTPEGYGVGGQYNYYFSHMLNCVYDCRYCFLQGMYRSAHYVVFVNYNDFFAAMDEKLALHEGQPVWFFSGYDCDSLAFEPVTGFAHHLLSYLETRPQAVVELRTKSTQIRTLLQRDALPNALVAFSLTPEPAAASLEHRTPSVAKRIRAMGQLAAGGWRLGLRFDPLLDDTDFELHYERLFREVFQEIDSATVHSVTIGAFRMPRSFFRNVVRLYPDEPLLAGAFDHRANSVSYSPDRQREMFSFCLEQLRRYVQPEIIYTCAEEQRVVHIAPVDSAQERSTGRPLS